MTTPKRPGPRRDRSTQAPLSTRCEWCNRKVGLLWYRGHSTLVDGPIESDGTGGLKVRPHHCDPADDGSIDPAQAIL